MPTPLDVVVVWHMHQPYYKDPLKNEYALPWTYLHGIKDYFDMPAIVEDTPGARAVFNLVPSLIEQILDYAAGTAVDPFLIKGKAAPADLSREDRIFLLENFFSANRQRMIEPSRRYLELLYMAGEGKPGSASDRVKHFSAIRTCWICRSGSFWPGPVKPPVVAIRSLPNWSPRVKTSPPPTRSCFLPLSRSCCRRSSRSTSVFTKRGASSFPSHPTTTRSCRCCAICALPAPPCRR